MALDNKYGEVTVETDSEENPLNGAEEPVFLLRAKDMTSVPVMQAYREKAKSLGLGEEFVASMDDAIAAFQTWQADNAELVTTPD